MKPILLATMVTATVTVASQSFASPTTRHGSALRLDSIRRHAGLTQSADRGANRFAEPGEGRQATRSAERDSLWNGMLIGGAAGALYGMAIAPRQFCGSNDPECAAIVRVAIGLPSIAGGVGLGALVDYLVGRTTPDRASVRPRVDVAPVVGRGARGGIVRVRF